MSVTRRNFLRMGGLAAVAVAATGCESLEQHFTSVDLPDDALATGTWQKASPAVRLLNRTGYGPRPGDVAHVEKIGHAAYIEEQLAADAIKESRMLILRLRSLMDILNPDTGLLFDSDDNRLVTALRQSTILRSTYSRKQLYERNVEFWSDHFNIYAFKGQGPQLKVVDDQVSIRSNAFGSFRDILGASARSAAMLGYLDNGVNRRGVPNENYAREIMELHTLGVHGGYTQRDVKEVARCLTGWTAEKHWHRGRFLFDPDAHDNGAKVVLGHSIAAGGGIHDGEQVLDIVANHPATARHIATKMCAFYLGHAPKKVVDDVAATYTQTSGSVRDMLRTLLTEQNLAESEPIFKRPYDYVVSAMRALNCDTDGGHSVQGHLESMGQLPFGWPMPNGYPLQERSWVGGLVPRWNFALALLGGEVENSKVDTAKLGVLAKTNNMPMPDALLRMAFGSADDTSIAPLKKTLEARNDVREAAAVLVMSPHFQWR